MYDVLIIGAGPAGCTAALALREANLKVGLVDKAIFPRDKVCGDAIPARASKVLRDLDPAFEASLANFPQQVATHACRVVAPSGEQFDYAFHTPGHCSARLDFDQLLMDLVTEHTATELLMGQAVKQVRRRDGAWQVETNQGQLHARMLLGCDGANGPVARQLTGREMDAAHHCAAVRGYYRGIQGLNPNRMEIHFLENWLPGYFWIFPLPDGRANVGFGMLSNQLQQKQVQLRQALPAIVEAEPALQARFAEATLEGPVVGFGLPMGSRKVRLSGEGFLLCGDAAALVEPATGEGIGNAMLSGQMAARHTVDAFRAGDFSADRLQAYQDELYGKLWKDLRNKYRAQQFLGERKWLMNWLVRRANRPGLIRWLMKKVF